MISFKIDNMQKKKPITILQEKLARLLPLKHFLITGFARNGFFLLIKAFRWDATAEIIVPAYTCSIIKHTVEAAGVTPVPVDAEDNGINIDPEKIRASITPRTKAIYVVHTYGAAARIDAICEIARIHNLIVIEDLAHAPFALYKGKPLGTYGDFAILSFIKKNINHEGGAVATNNTSIYAKMVMLQREYERKRIYSRAFILDNAVRLVGSWWESKFSLMSLAIMKFNDFLNVLLYKGAYGISINPMRFTAGTRSIRTTARQLDGLYRQYRETKPDYYKFKDRFKGVRSFELHQSGSDTLPYYFTGAVTEPNRLYRILSFRTWRNSNTPGAYPRADFLYANYRIFAKALLRFQRWCGTEREVVNNHVHEKIRNIKKGGFYYDH